MGREYANIGHRVKTVANYSFDRAHVPLMGKAYSIEIIPLVIVGIKRPFREGINDVD